MGPRLQPRYLQVQFLKSVFFKAKYRKEKNTFLAFISLYKGVLWMLEI